MNQKIVATITAVVGSLGILLGVAAAFGLNLTQDQVEALTALGGVIVTLCGIWLHPSIPVGVQGP